MKEIICRQTKRRCSVNGCTNLSAKLYSRSNDMSNSVWLCDSCVSEIYNKIFPETLLEHEKLKYEYKKLKKEHKLLLHEHETLKKEQPITIQNAQIPGSDTTGVVNPAISTITSTTGINK